MSRSGYSDDCGGWDLIRWRGAVASAIKGARGQAFLKELAAAMDAMPDKRLIAHELQADGGYCTIGVLGQARGVDMARIDPDDREQVARAFGIAPALAAEIVFENDEQVSTHEWIVVEICGPVRPHYPEWGEHAKTVRVPLPGESVEANRWHRMRKWVDENIARAPATREHSPANANDKGE